MKRLFIGFLGTVVLSGCSTQNEVIVQDDFTVVEQTHVHKYGFNVSPQDFKARGGDGQVITNLKNGVIATNTYSHNVLHGDTTYTFPYTTTVEKVLTYDQGRVVKEDLYYTSGTPRQRTEYQDNQGKVVTIWYENGTPQAVEHYINSALAKGDYYTNDSELDSRVENYEGTRINRDLNGLLLRTEIIKNGEVVSATDYYTSGAPKRLTSYRHGVIDGLQKTFAPSGEPLTVEEWSQGNQTGITTTFLNGEKVSEIPYVNGVKSGVERRFRDGSNVVDEITWVDGYPK
jgi:antitoxin component YwqK of YwqJK toxin-antitoxin module